MGASRPSGLVGWVDLLTPLGKEIGIRVTEDDDLPAVAQYYINRTLGNRGPLILHVKNVLGSQVRPSAYHYHLARSNVGTIWTTNYDRLIEEALALAGVRSRVPPWGTCGTDLSRGSLWCGPAAVRASGWREEEGRWVTK